MCKEIWTASYEKEGNYNKFRKESYLRIIVLRRMKSLSYKSPSSRYIHINIDLHRIYHIDLKNLSHSLWILHSSHLPILRGRRSLHLHADVHPGDALAWPEEAED